MKHWKAIAFLSLSSTLAMAGPTTSPAQPAFEQGDLDAALPVLRSAAKSDPSLCRQLAEVNELLGREDDAKAAWAAAIANAHDPAEARRNRIRLALLNFDTGATAEAFALLDAVAADDAGAEQAGVIASFYGQSAAAAKYLSHVRAERPGVLLLAANAALHSGKFSDANATLERARRDAASPADQQYTIERSIAVARQAGTLSALADRWLHHSALPADQCLPLAIVLRETGRDNDLLAWWREHVRQPIYQRTLLSSRFISEIAAAALQTGVVDDTSSIIAELFAADPAREQALVAAVRLLLGRGDLSGADRLLNDEIGKARQNAARLQWLGKLARAQGRDDAAHRAAAALVSLGGEDAIRGDLLDASVSLRAGDNARAATALQHAANLCEQSPRRATDVAAGFDAAGLDDQAIALLQSTTQRHFDNDAMLQLSALLVQQQRPREAMHILQRLRKSSTNPGTRSQASQRLLELAGATNTNAQLAADLQNDLTSAEDVSLLADVYLALHQSESAVTLLRATKLLDEPARLQRLSTLLLRMKEYSRADEVLRQIVKSDPYRAVQTLEQIAWVATERKHADDAAAAIDEIRARAGAGPAAEEMLGGVYDRLGFPAEAALHYRQAIASSNDSDATADDWLLWSSAMIKSGQPDVASQRLQILSEETTSDAVFTVAADALLGVDTPVPALRAARRAAAFRASQSPNDLSLLHVVRDLSQELNDSAFDRHVSEVLVALSPDERPQLLRELAEQASTAGATEEAIAWGESILALGDDFPPQVFLDLGQNLLVAGRHVEAGRAFGRAIDASSEQIIVPRVAAIYERFDHVDEAARLLAPLVQRFPSDIATTEMLAREREILGQSREAFALYLHALDLAEQKWRATPVDTTPDPAGDAPELPPAEVTFQRLAASSLATARTPNDQAAFIALLRAKVDASLEQSSKSKAAANPSRLKRLRDTARSAAITFGDVAAVSAIDNGVGPGNRPVARQAAEADKLSELFIAGDSAGISHLIQSALSVTAAEADTAMPPLIAAAVATDDPASADRWALHWIDLVATPLKVHNGRVPVGPRLAAIELAEQRVSSAVSTVWNVLSPKGRQEVVEALLALGQNTDLSVVPRHPSLLAMRLSAATGVEVPDRANLTSRLLGSRATADAAALELFAITPPADRAALLQLALQRVAGSHQLSLLLQLTDRTTEPFDEATARVIVDAADAMQPPQIFTANAGWFTNVRQKPVLAPLSRAVQRLGADADPAAPRPTVECAVAFAISGQQAEADRLAMEAIDHSMARLPVAVKALSQPARAALVERVLHDSALPSQSAARQVAAATILEAAGRSVDALAIERRTVAEHPDNDDAASKLAARLQSDGRLADLADTFGPRSGRVWSPALRRSAARALRQLFRADESTQADAQSAFQYLLGPMDAETFARLLRQNLEGVRSSGQRFVDTIDRPERLGLNPHAELIPVSARLADSPGSVDDLLAAIRSTLIVEGHPSESMTAMVRTLADAAASHPAVRDSLLHNLKSRLSQHRLAAADVLIVQQLALANVPLPDELVAPLRDAARDGSQESLAALAASHSSNLSELQKWVEIRRRMTTGNSSLPGPLDVPSDVPLAETLAGMLDRKQFDEVDRVLAELRQHDRIGRKQPALGFVWARMAAERRDVDEFRNRLEGVFDERDWQPEVPLADVRLALPQSASNVTAVADAVEQAAHRSLDRRDFVTVLSTVAVWAHQLGAVDVAQRLVTDAKLLAESSGTGADQLAIVDAARETGDAVTADSIEIKLLRDRCLPAVRILPLLQRVKAISSDEHQSLYEGALRYCGSSALAGTNTR